jgi:hypothetical protein
MFADLFVVVSTVICVVRFILVYVVMIIQYIYVAGWVYGCGVIMVGFGLVEWYGCGGCVFMAGMYKL